MNLLEMPRETGEDAIRFLQRFNKAYGLKLDPEDDKALRILESRRSSTAQKLAAIGYLQMRVNFSIVERAGLL